jgi:hypothetical protein
MNRTEPGKFLISTKEESSAVRRFFGPVALFLGIMMLSAAAYQYFFDTGTMPGREFARTVSVSLIVILVSLKWRRGKIARR